jgi:hypothetical protein
MDASVIRASSFLSSIAALLTLTPETVSIIPYYSTELLKMALVLRVLCFGMIFLMNALSIFFSTIHSLNLLKVWNFFVKSMNLSTSLNATVINSSLNYFFTVTHHLIRQVVELFIGSVWIHIVWRITSNSVVDWSCSDSIWSVLNFKGTEIKDTMTHKTSMKYDKPLHVFRLVYHVTCTRYRGI